MVGNTNLHHGSTQALSMPVRCFCSPKDVALVLDGLSGSGQDTHSYVQTWHLWPDAAVTTTGLDVSATGATDPTAAVAHSANGPRRA